MVRAVHGPGLHEPEPSARTRNTGSRGPSVCRITTATPGTRAAARTSQNPARWARLRWYPP